MARRPRHHGALETGRRVFLRRPLRGDAIEYVTLRRRSAEFLRRWEPLPPRRKTATTAFSEWFESRAGGRHEKLLICRVTDGAILGAINFNEIVRGPAQCAFLGYWIGAPHARQGYMTEALRLALRHGFGALGLHRVEANIMPVNRASIALVRPSGYWRQVYPPGYLKLPGRWRDHERWALVANLRRAPK